MNNFIQITNEKQALKLIRKYLGRIYCPKCERKHYIRRLDYHRYYCKKCRYKFSLKILLGLKNSKLSYLQLIKLIYCFSKRKTLLTAMDLTNISYPTARYAYSRLRRLLPRSKAKIAGDIIVDECFVGKQKTNNQVMVAGAVNRQFTYVNLSVIPDRE